VNTLFSHNCTALGCTNDSIFAIGHFLKTFQAKVNFPILGDFKGEVSKEFNCKIENGPKEGFSLPSTFIIGPDSRILYKE
jgi:peroxiredoxin